MRLLPALICLPVLAAGLGAAEAHPGHVADAGSGHSHWLALIVLGGLGALAAGGLVYRLVAGRLPFVDGKARER